MPKLTKKIPSYGHHKPSGQARVFLYGKYQYLGRYDSSESRHAYDEAIREYLKHRRLGSTPLATEDNCSVDELLLSYLDDADETYTFQGRPTGEAAQIRYALRPLSKLYGSALAKDFKPSHLKDLRRSLVEEGRLARKTINARIGRIVRFFKWCVEHQHVSPDVHGALRCVVPFKAGRTTARESSGVEAVDDDRVDAIRDYTSPQIWAMVSLQRLTGMRPNEVCIMRSCDINTAGSVWSYIPSHHKNLHRNQARKVPLGPQCQAILKPWLHPDLDAFLFQPREVVAAFHAARHEAAQTPRVGKQIKPRKRKPRRTARDRYTTTSYRRAVQYACRKAKIPSWHPNQLRHSVATKVQRAYDIDAARVILGHATPDTTTIYTDRDWERAERVARDIG